MLLQKVLISEVHADIMFTIDLYLSLGLTPRRDLVIVLARRLIYYFIYDDGTSTFILLLFFFINLFRYLLIYF